MESYIDKIRASEAAEQDRVKASKLDTAGDTRLVCDKPLTQQIEELMRSLPPAERQRRWTMAEFVARLSGRYSVNPTLCRSVRLCAVRVGGRLTNQAGS